MADELLKAIELKGEEVRASKSGGDKTKTMALVEQLKELKTKYAAVAGKPWEPPAGTAVVKKDKKKEGGEAAAAMAEEPKAGEGKNAEKKAAKAAAKAAKKADHKAGGGDAPAAAPANKAAAPAAAPAAKAAAPAARGRNVGTLSGEAGDALLQCVAAAACCGVDVAPGAVPAAARAAAGALPGQVARAQKTWRHPIYGSATPSQNKESLTVAHAARRAAGPIPSAPGN